MVFKIGGEDRADWPLLQNGAINVYLKPSLFEQAISDLHALEYRIIRLAFESQRQFEAELSLALKWQEQFGYSPWNGNLDALNDGFRDEPLSSSDNTALCIENFQAYVREDEQAATGLLDIVESTSRDYLLFGKRLIALIQTNDPRFVRTGLGQRSTNWNPSEWFDSARGI